MTRRDYVVRRYTLTRPQYLFLEALQGEAIERAAASSERSLAELAEDLRNWFRIWIGAKAFFVGALL